MNFEDEIYQNELTAMRLIGTASIAIYITQVYAFVHTTFSFLIGLMPNTFVLGCAAGSFLLSEYISKLLAKHNFDLQEVVTKRMKEIEEEQDDDLF